MNGELTVSDFLFWIMKEFWDQIVMTAARHWECDGCHGIAHLKTVPIAHLILLSKIQFKINLT